MIQLYGYSTRAPAECRSMNPSAAVQSRLAPLRSRSPGFVPAPSSGTDPQQPIALRSAVFTDKVSGSFSEDRAWSVHACIQRQECARAMQPNAMLEAVIRAAPGYLATARRRQGPRAMQQGAAKSLNKPNSIHSFVTPGRQSTSRQQE